MKELGANLPAILTGDFNVDQTHSSYKALVSNGVLKDSYESADFRYATNGTFNSFDPNNFTESRIDHVFVSPLFKVKKYGVLTDTYRSTKATGTEKANVKDCPEEISIESYEAPGQSRTGILTIIISRQNRSGPPVIRIAWSWPDLSW